MSGNNPGGGNQFGSSEAQPQYGDVKRETQLTRAAPMSGAAVATHTLEAPRREGKQAARGRGAAVPEAPMPVSTAPGPQGPPPATFQQIAAIPGASPLVQTLFGNAAST